MTTFKNKHIHAACSLCCGAVAALIALGSLNACSDMLDTDSSRQLFEPELDQKTDSIFYALGILQGLQQLADQYAFVGEMRGDLVTTTSYTDNNLRQLYNFTATTTNKYDSAYVYYRIINNCNYYIAHRDTTLRTGATYVAMQEYVAVKAIRAWTYMQLARTYGKVPFYTEPLTQISQIDNNTFPELDMEAIVNRLAPDLEQYTGYPTPVYSGTPNGSNIMSDYLYMPVDVVLGDMYLEVGNYSKAASHYVTYLTKVASSPFSAYMQPYSSRNRYGMMGGDDLPSDWAPANNSTLNGSTTWSTIFTSSTDLITYIPMAANSLQGTTTDIPLAYGYDYYATDKTGNSRYVDEIQIVASDKFLDLSTSSDYYYQANLLVGSTSDMRINLTKLGDTRYRGVIRETEDTETDSTTTWITKNNQARVILYRKTTVLLRLAEAFNRLGMVDAAFAILKDGISEELVKADSTGAAYISEATKTALKTTYPLLSDENKSKFSDNNAAYFGIHMHGAGYCRDWTGAVYQPNLSPYQPDTIIGLKMKEIAESYSVSVGTTKEDSINAMEDLLCDEYALEFAFEGCRYYDLCRLARHKNAKSPAAYPANFGYVWLGKKLEGRGWDESKLYLPFK